MKIKIGDNNQIGINNQSKDCKNKNEIKHKKFNIIKRIWKYLLTTFTGIN